MLARYVAVRRGRLDVVDDIIGFAPSSHGTTNPLAGPAGVFGCTACEEQQAGSAFMRKVNEPPPEAPGPAWYTVLTTTHDEVVTPYQSQALAGDRATNVILQDRCPADFFEHVTISATRSRCSGRSTRSSAPARPTRLRARLHRLELRPRPLRCRQRRRPPAAQAAQGRARQTHARRDPCALRRSGGRGLHRPARERAPGEGVPDPRRAAQARADPAGQRAPRPRHLPRPGGGVQVVSRRYRLR